MATRFEIVRGSAVACFGSADRAQACQSANLSAHDGSGFRQGATSDAKAAGKAADQALKDAEKYDGELGVNGDETMRITGKLPMYAAACGLALALALAGCGGGGGGGGVPGTATPDPLSVQDSYQRYLDGNPTLTWDDSEIEARWGRWAATVTHGIAGAHYATLLGLGFHEPVEAIPYKIEADDIASIVGALTDYQVQPVMTHSGVPLLRAAEVSLDPPEQHVVYFGLLDDLAFSVSGGLSLPGAPFTTASVDGALSGSSPPAPSIIGGATWTGAVLGADVSDTDAFGNLIIGDAMVRLEDLGAPAVDVSLTGLRDVEAGVAHGDMGWSDLGLVDGVFTDSADGDARTITGAFFGSDHGEVGGVFDRNGVAGAFGAKRD